MRKLLSVIVFLLLCALLVGVASAGYLVGSYTYGNGTQFYVNVSTTGAIANHNHDFILTNATCVSNGILLCTNGTTKANWTDIQFTDGSNTPIPFWIWNNTGTSTTQNVTIKIASIPASNATIRFYYGNETKTVSSMDIYNTFPFSDDFNDATLNTTQWTKDTSGSVTQSGGIVTVVGESTGYNSGITGKTTFNTSTNKIIFRATAVYASGYDQVGWASEENGANPAYLIQARTEPGGGRKLSTLDAGALNTASWAWVVGNVQSMYRAGTTAYFYDYSGISANTAMAVPVVNLNASILSTSIAGDYISVDWIVVEDYQTNPPTTSLFTGIQAQPISASFTASTNPSSTGNLVTLTDTSTGSPTTWNWTIDGVITNTTQNAAYVFSTVGTHTIDLNVTNSTGSFSNLTKTQTVTNASGFNQQDVYMVPHFSITLHIVDSSNAPIPVVTVTDNYGQSYTTSNGTAYFTEDAGAVVFYFAATGYTSKAMSYIVDEGATHTVQLATAGGTTNIDLRGTPKDVKFHIQSFFGSPITDANVSIQGVSTTTGNWDWLAVLLSISLGETPINSTEMSGITDSNGDIVFLMLDSIKYNITVTKSGYTFPNTIIAPQASQYTISANMNESWFSGGNNTLKEVNVSVTWANYNGTHSFVNITYDDQTTTTTGGTITVYRDAVGRMANATPVSSMDITSSSCSNSTLVTVPTGGASYGVVVNATTTSGENVVRTFTHSFKGSPVSLPGFTPETLLWLSLFILIFTAAFAGALHAPQMAIILCVESWVFWSIGWLEYLISGNGYFEGAIVVILSLATFISVIWSITEGKAKGKRSS